MGLCAFCSVCVGGRGQHCRECPEGNGVKKVQETQLCTFLREPRPSIKFPFLLEPQFSGLSSERLISLPHLVVSWEEMKSWEEGP